MEARKDPELANIEADHPGWRCWRGKHRNGSDASYNATREDPAAGIYPTVGADTADGLRAELEDQKRRAERGEPRPEVAPLPLPPAVTPDPDADFNPAYM